MCAIATPLIRTGMTATLSFHGATLALCNFFHDCPAMLFCDTTMTATWMPIKNCIATTMLWWQAINPLIFAIGTLTNK